jgi:hypothetical protein
MTLWPGAPTEFLRADVIRDLQSRYAVPPFHNHNILPLKQTALTQFAWRVSITPVPEPGPLVLLAGLVSFEAIGRRRSRCT